MVWFSWAFNPSVPHVTGFQGEIAAPGGHDGAERQGNKGAWDL